MSQRSYHWKCLFNVNPTVFLKLGAGLINRTEGVVGNQQLEIDHELNVNLYRT
jgi:hypothetical protein